MTREKTKNNQNDASVMLAYIILAISILMILIAAGMIYSRMAEPSILDEKRPREPHLKVIIRPDQPEIEPGEIMKIWVNVTNIGDDEYLSKQMHTIVTAKSWLGLTAHTETKSYSRDFPLNKMRYAYIETALPKYTPPGTYEIQMWTTYGSPDGRRQIAEPWDLDSKVATTEVKIKLGIVFILMVGIGLLQILLMLYALWLILTKSRKGPQQPGALDTEKGKPRKLEATRSLEKIEKKTTDIIYERAIITALVLSIAISLVYVGATKRSKETFSAIYLVPGQYSNYVEGGTVTYTYGVECFEDKPTQYTLSILLEGTLIKKKEFELCQKGKYSRTKIEVEDEFMMPKEITYPAKVNLQLAEGENNYEVGFWLRGKKGADEEEDEV